ncbi:MAG TPA: hypothetical protein VGI75_12630 [Pirellulales bacterium]|jgi:hypothetical protein
MKRYLAMVLCAISVTATSGFAEDLQPIFNKLDVMQARADNLRTSIQFIQQLAPTEVDYMSRLCDEFDTRVALCEFMMNRATENGLDPASQPDIVEQYRMVNQVYAQLQQADAQLSRRCPH